MKIRALSAAIIFITLTVFKFAFPTSFTRARELVIPETEDNSSLASDVLAIGKKLSGDEDAVYVWEKQLTDKTEEAPAPSPSSAIETEGFELEDMVESNLRNFLSYEGSEFIPPDTEDAAVILEAPEVYTEDEPDELTILMDEFLTAQAAMTAIAIPDSVATAPVSINFEYTPPVEAEKNSFFGYRVHPIYGDIRFHYGTDFTVAHGDPIACFADGTVIAAQEFSGYGQTVIVEHADGITSMYAHCSALDVSLGDVVTKGQTIARVGQTGNVTGPHLHFELQANGQYINPEFYL